jgi:hypothetical protein
MKNLNYPYDDFLRLSKGPTFVSDMKCFGQNRTTSGTAGNGLGATMKYL